MRPPWLFSDQDFDVRPGPLIGQDNDYVLSAIELYTSFGPDPASPIDEAHTALAAYLGLAALAGLTDWVRTRAAKAELPNLLAPNPIRR